jgi:hypothetical protein
MLINFSNHPSVNWSEKQLSESKAKYLEVIDIPFPIIPPSFFESQITDIVQKYVKNILDSKSKAVHIMGELNFVFKCVNLLKMNCITCMASAAEKNVIEANGNKRSTFNFIQFREY